MIKDSVPSYDGDEIASLRIEIKYGYMYPLLKERVEKANPLDNLKWTEYWGGEFSDEVESLEFDQREISLYNLSKDVTLMKNFFKTFYETGTLPEEYME